MDTIIQQLVEKLGELEVRVNQLEIGVANLDLKKRQAAVKKAQSAVDGDWIDGLYVNPAYKGIDIMVELGKAQAWCEANRRQCNRRFFINWLNNNKAIGVVGAAAAKPVDSTHTLQKQLEIVEKEIVKVRGRAIEDALTVTYTPKDRELLNKLLAQRKEIKRKLGLP
jgi:hypothetical protein